MKVWLITIGEPLPTDGTGERLLRSGLLAEQLTGSGHDVTWWTSSFDHVRKQFRSPGDACRDLGRTFRIRLLGSSGYRSNVSLQRLRDHRSLAQKFARQARGEPIPDVILSSLPTLELCDEAVDYGRAVRRPVVLDVRDLWPDAFLDLVPGALCPLASLALWPLRKSAARACGGAAAIVGISSAFVEWGVRHADRPRGGSDCVFPMGYREQRPSSLEITRSDEFWRHWGVGTRPGLFRLCFFGSMNRHFEIDTAIEAARILARQSRDVQFVLCGEGERSARWRALAADCPHIVFPGWVDAAKIWTLMRMSDAGLAPYVSSRNFIGNLPNKPVEYLSAGLPIISSLQGNLAELLNRHNCGLTYPNRDASELAAAVASLMDQPDRRRRMAENGLRLYRQHFVAETVYRQMAQYLVELAAERKAAAA